MSKGVIYILTNPSFPDYIKIGYAKNLERRLQQLNRSETIPFAFRAYAVYEKLKGFTHPVQGTIWFTYNGEKLDDLRKRIAQQLE